MAEHDGLRLVLTDRLDLRPLTATDLHALHLIVADPRNSELMPGGVQRDAEVTRAWIERFGGRWESNGLGYWTVRLRSTAEVIGVGGADRRPQFWNILYWVDHRHWGHGYGTEIACAASSAAALVAPDVPLAGWIHERNLASQSVALRIGLQDFGPLEPEHWNGEPMHYWADRAP